MDKDVQTKMIRAMATNVILCRLEQIGRARFGIVEIDAQDTIEGALSQIENDAVGPAWAERATPDAPKQDENKTLIEAAAVFNREKAAA